MKKNESQVYKDLNSIKKLIEPYAVDTKSDVKKARKKKDDIVTITINIGRTLPRVRMQMNSVFLFFLLLFFSKNG